MYKGSCLCGAIKFRISGVIKDIVHCHCSHCRKAQGSAFATNGNVDANDFVFLSGEGNLTDYESTPGQKKYFCKTCGSPIMSKKTSKPQQIRIRLGTITSNIKERPMAHIFTTSKANWETINANLPQHEEYEPGR
ncbi:MAG: GFA family protein [Gammaproteobacteria bacterium]|nr:GFA family protein [Gammaproteobacteria bacterium]